MRISLPARKPLRLTVNGEAREAMVKPYQTLLEALREELGLTGAKEGCANGNCGCCTVLLNGQAVNSCLVLALEADGGEVWTVEGMAQGGGLHPLQRAFLQHGAVQCGFCTPGFLLSARYFLEHHPDPPRATEQEVRYAVSGNLCRCTGYDKIVRAILAVARGEVK